MIKLLALFGVFFMSTAHAADWPVVTDRDGTHTKMFTRMSGGISQLDATTTQDVVSWGFSSSGVRICVMTDLGADESVYMRIGTTLTATSSDNFINGAGNQGADAAAVFVPQGTTGNIPSCEIYPLNVRGLIFHTAGTGATVDVQAFD